MAASRRWRRCSGCCRCCASQAHGLTPAQVVAIASNIGGKQALETVQRLLPVLCQAHGLTPAQVVAIASNGGKQALETVQRLCCARPMA